MYLVVDELVVACRSYKSEVMGSGKRIDLLLWFCMSAVTDTVVLLVLHQGTRNDVGTSCNKMVLLQAVVGVYGLYWRN